MRKCIWAYRATFVVWGALTWTGCASPMRMDQRSNVDSQFGVPRVSSNSNGTAQPRRTTQLAFKPTPEEQAAMLNDVVDPSQPVDRRVAANSRTALPASSPRTPQPTGTRSPADKVVARPNSNGQSMPAKKTVSTQRATGGGRPTSIQPVNVEIPVDATEVVETVETNQTAHSMSIDELLSFAQQNHPLLMVRESEVQVARAGVVGACVRDNPQFVLNTDTPVDVSGPTQIGFRVTFPFITGDKLAHRQAAAMATVHATAMLRYVDESVVMLDAVDAASEVVYLRQLLDVQQELQQVAEERASKFVSDLEMRRSGSSIRISNKLSAELDAMKLKSRQFETERALTVAQSELARAIGAAADMQIDVSDSLEIPDGALLPVETVTALARDRSPLISSISAKMNETQYLHNLAHAEGIPDFELGPRVQTDLDTHGGQSIGLRFNTDLPIHDRNQGDIAETAAEMQVDQANMQLADFQAVSDAVAAYKELIRIRENALELRELTSKMEERYEQFASDERVKDVITEADALELRQELVSQKLVELELRYQFFRQLHRLQVLVGQSIVSGVQNTPVVAGEVELAAPVGPEGE